jgi:mannose-1-phosphate guanylyltransferase
MLPLLNKPFIEYVIGLLAEHGVTEIILSVGYLPTMFQDFVADFSKFNVRLDYVRESEPLGTCGAVKNVEHLLDDTFIVFNGDILTNLNISHLIEYHQAKKAMATIALTSVEDPTMYGLVPLNSDGHVEEFLEKPSWDEVTTDLVNAGTYVLEPEALSYAPKGENYSFERGLFPTLLEKGLPIYGFPSSAYWIDIGTPQKYLKAHCDLLDGRLGTALDGLKIRPRVWFGKNTKVSKTANLFGPILIGDNCQIDDNANLVGPISVGSGCQVAKGARIENSIILDGCQIGKSAVIKSSILANKITIGEKVHIEETSVLGESMRVGKENWLKRGIRVWPGTSIEPGTIRF